MVTIMMIVLVVLLDIPGSMENVSKTTEAITSVVKKVTNYGEVDV